MVPTLKNNSAAGYQGPGENRAFERCRSSGGVGRLGFFFGGGSWFMMEGGGGGG